MARVPGEADFSGIPSARSGRAIAREDVSARFAGAEALGAGIRQGGASVVSIATDRARKQQELETFNTEARFQQFNNAETQRYIDTTRDVPAGGAAGFAQTYAASYDERARSFMEQVPEHLRPQYDARLVNLRGTFEAQGGDFEIAEQIRSTGQVLDDTLNNTILPRITTAAALPDAAAQQEALGQIIADGEALINANPYLSPIQKDEAIQAWQLRAQTAFVEGVPPEQRGEWLGTEPLSLVEQIIGVESAGDPNAANPNSSALGLGQFIESTWYDLVSAYRPDLMQGRSREEVLALRTDPVISREMTERYIEQNAQHLASRGLPVTPGTIYLAHFLGPGGAQSLLSVPAGTPVSEILPAGVVAANRSILEGVTAGEVIAWADNKMAGAPTTRANRLDAISYEDRNALAADAATQAAAQASDRAAAQAAQTAAYVNAAQIGARDSSYGYAQLQRDVANGTLTDYDDIHKIEGAIEEYQGDVRSLAAAQANLANPEFQWLPGDDGHQDMVDRLWEAAPAMQEALVNPGADQAQRQQAQASLAALVDRTGVLPVGAVNAITAGLESNDPAQMAAAVSLIDALGQVDHFAVGRALTQAQGTAAATLATAVDIVGRTGNEEVFRRVAGELALIQSTPNYKPPTRDAAEEQTAIDGTIGEAYRFLPSHQADVLAVAGHVFNSMARERGVPNDLSTPESVRLYETALQMAAGARYESGVQYGGTTDVHGIDTLVPSGMRADGVERAFDALTDDELVALGGPPVSESTTLKVDAEDVRRGILIAVGDGTYRVAAEISPTGNPVFYANAAGDFWVLDMRQLVEIREKAAIAANTVQQGDPALAAEIANNPEAIRDRADETERAAFEAAGGTTIAPPGITPLPLREGGNLMQMEPAPGQPAMTAAEARAEAERRAQAGEAPPPVPAQDEVPEGFVRLLGGAVVPYGDGASDLKQRIKTRLERDPPVQQRREPKDEQAAMTQRAIAARKRMLMQRDADTARVPPSAPAAAAPARTASAPPTIPGPALPPAIRRSQANGIRSGASEVPMDSQSIPQFVPPLPPAIAGQIRPENVAGYARPATVTTTPVERRPLPPVQEPPAAIPGRYASTPENASPAVRDRDIGSMTLAELYWFLDYGNPTAAELRQMSIRTGLLQEQAEVNAVVAGAR